MKRFILFVFFCLTLVALQAQTPPAPTSLSVYAPTLSWCPVEGATGYKVYMGSTRGNYTTSAIVGNVSTYQGNALTAGTYYFAVGALNNGEESPVSNEVVLTVVPPPSPSPSITQLLISVVTTAQATVIWVTNTDCSGVVLWGTAPSSWRSATANNLGTTDHLAVITGLTARTHYLYKVRSTCGGQTIESEVRSFNTK